MRSPDIHETTGTVIAITGDVGAGKSQVARIFESLGAHGIDADQVVAELWRTRGVIEPAAARWGRENILDADGRVSHKAVARIIFDNPEECGWLTSFLHPIVKTEIARQLEHAGPWVVVEIPLLFEAGVPSWVTAKVFVTASREARLARCRARGWDEAEVTRRERFFFPSETRMARSDHVIHNNGSLEDLKKIVENLKGLRPLTR